MAPDDAEFLCEGWTWDPVLRELRKHRRKRKGWEDEPEAVERLQPVTSVTWYRWSQAPMQTSTGQITPSSLSRVVAAYEAGGDLTINEYDRSCAEKLALVIAGAYGLSVIEEGAPGGRRDGNLPERDQMGRLVNRTGREDVVLDEIAGEVTVTKPKRPFGKSRRVIRTNEIRRLELGYEVKGPTETFTVWAIVARDDEKLPLASYSGFEGWADPREWREFTRELGRSLGIEVRDD
jgi:hypothetical protein